MIFRKASPQDQAALSSFDVGDLTLPWSAEVAETVNGLVAWWEDPETGDETREVVVAEVDGEVVAVTAHVALVGEEG